MANPIAFKPRPYDPRQELQHRLEAAPAAHAEALLVLWELLDVSHRHGVLDALVGAIGSKNAIAGKIAEYAKEPASTQAIRNGLTLAQALGALDPDLLSRVVKAVTPSPSLYATSEASAAHQQAVNPVLGTGQTEDSVRREQYKHRGDDAKAEVGRASVPHGENSSGSPSLPDLEAQARRQQQSHSQGAGDADAPFDMTGEPPSFWQLFRRFTGRDARRALGYAANMLTSVSRAADE